MLRLKQPGCSTTGTLPYPGSSIVVARDGEGYGVKGTNTTQPTSSSLDDTHRAARTMLCHLTSEPVRSRPTSQVSRCDVNRCSTQLRRSLGLYRHQFTVAASNMERLCLWYTLELYSHATLQAFSVVTVRTYVHLAFMCTSLSPLLSNMQSAFSSLLCQPVLSELYRLVI